MKASILISILLIALTGCQTSQKQQAEQAIVPAQTEDQLASDLNGALEAKFGRIKDTEIESALRAIAVKLASVDPTLSGNTNINFLVLASTARLSGPGLKRFIIFSKGMLSQPKYENELAFLIAMNLNLIRSDEPRRRLAALRGEQVGESLIEALPTKPRDPKVGFDPLKERWFDVGGLYDFGTVASLETVRASVRLMHTALFDPRGAVTLIERGARVDLWPPNAEILKVVRDEIAKLSPLRDPIVRGQSFEIVQSRLQGKKHKQKGEKKN